MPSEPRLSRRQALALGLGAAAGTFVAARSATDGWRAAPAEGAAPIQVQVQVQVQVDARVVVGTVAPRTLGLSFEKSTLALPLFTSTNTPLVTLLRLLGPGVLRVGGNSVERTTWDPHGPGLVAGTVSPADLDRLAGFAQAVGWPVLYGTPFVAATPADVADEAAQVADRLGQWLDQFELCNEPDLYLLDPTAAALAGTYPTFRARWEQVADAIAAATPASELSGPAPCLLQNVPGWTQPFAADEGDRIGLVTQHYYRGFAPPETIDELLADDPLFDTALPQVAAAAETAQVGYRLAETNSFASGGAPGVSNTLASALWGAGLGLRAAARGAEGINIHTSGAGPGYPPFVQVGGQVTQIRPLFAGLQLAAGVGSGALLSTTLAGAPSTLAAWAVRRPDASVALVLVNTAADSSVDVAIDLGAAVQAATVRWLTGPALDATTGVTFGGAAAGIDGSWDPAPPIPLPVDSSHLSVTVGSATAGLIAVTLAVPPTSTTTTPVPTSTSTTTDASSTAPTAPAPVAAPVTAAPELTG